MEENEEGTIRCRRCGRKLTNPESRKKGIGPVCEKKEEEQLKLQNWSQTS